ncbi:pyridine nucleotide-disulphide oxidoreductase dimerization region [Dethiosulfovibrio peptidovorans DSM 11002]|jgi:dihydrolipoamide dehydrogenase|uniref:Pyridine nucleotide-disulphide oxidoreductase dimerization region n=1 Tax=Dethiosulfovibrio peptidovorans DSM 11002 TaxID=469381 RepID=D2Z2I5_9BACT|nr:FAD-dependent oxidoreductase [Dethiosulfovibrio peptidovorans]EFC90141.1 pyridine nucleotide-disulphide oxidoreductase dimerization region [Dethiosulfovibrio peptidovorans DSM 11002]
MIYDLVILGGGPGGYRAAELASREGFKTALVEKDRLGGTCLNRGCIPTKSYYSDVVGKLGSLDAMWEKKEKVVDKLRKGVSTLMNRSSVDVIEGEGRITDVSQDVKRLSVTTEKGEVVLESKRLLIAVGAMSRPLSFPGSDLEGIVGGDWAVTDRALWDPSFEDGAESVAVVGAGVIAVELACILKEMGKEVTLLKHSDQILRRSDGEIKKKVNQLVKKRKIPTVDFFRIEKVAREDGRLTVFGEAQGESMEIGCDRLILAASMVPILKGYGLEESGIAFSDKGITVDEFMETSVPGVYAVGDCTGGAMLAHLAEYQALSAVEHMAGREYRINPDAIPSCIFFDPEIASVGLTEEEAMERGLEFVVGRVFFVANGMALAMDRSDGFVKVLADRESGRMLGVHIIGPEAATLISEAALAVDRGLTVKEVAYTVHPHPTLSECFKDALFRILEEI